MTEKLSNSHWLSALTSGAWITVTVSVLSASVSLQAASFELVVPAYFYPSTGSPWEDLAAAASQTPITAILNPASGPGAQRDNNYASAVNDLRMAGGRVIGYVPTGFGNRALDDILGDINAYREFYNLDGIFIDEMNNRGAQGVLHFYGDIYSHVKSVDPNWELMGNPGTNTSETFLTWPVADRLIITENFAADYDDLIPDDWVAGYDSARFVHLIHTATHEATMADQLEIAVSRNAGAVYITDDELPNPWDRLPNYWQTELQLVTDWKSSADINRDGVMNCEDVNRLTLAIVQRQQSVQFDLNGDGSVNVADRVQWLIAAEQDVGRSIPPGDANLDGRADVADWQIASPNLFSPNSSWCAGDWNTDGLIDGSDFNIWIENNSASSPTLESTVPEPTWNRVFVFLLLLGIMAVRRPNLKIRIKIKNSL